MVTTATPNPPENDTTGPGVVVWVGLAVVLIAAAVLSFDALRALAVAVKIPTYLAWLLPLAVDAGASVSCAVWLSHRVTEAAARFARSMTWSLLVITVVGNAAQLGMEANGIAPPWLVAVAVGAIPPAVVGGVVHLAVLVSRDRHPVVALVAEVEQPTASLTDADLLEHLRAWVDDEGGAIPSRERVRVQYGIGTSRADRIRTSLTHGQVGVAAGE